jgi:hypothetical protein
VPTRNDFTREEWRALRNAPQFVAFASAAAGNSGLFGSLSEGMAAASAFAAAARGNNLLIRELLDRQEVREAQVDLRALLESVTDLSAVGERLQDEAIKATHAGLAALQARNAEADASDFRKMLAWLAEEVANASTEGDFLGFGGERISEGERRFLERLYAVVGRR